MYENSPEGTLSCYCFLWILSLTITYNIVNYKNWLQSLIQSNATVNKKTLKANLLLNLGM